MSKISAWTFEGNWQELPKAHLHEIACDKGICLRIENDSGERYQFNILVAKDSGNVMVDIWDDTPINTILAKLTHRINLSYEKTLKALAGEDGDEHL